MRSRLRLSPQTLRVLEAFLDDPKEWKYGYDISKTTGLKSGTLYPILMRLAERELLEASWETAEVGKPPRHMYRFTRNGLREALEVVRSRLKSRSQRTAFGGVKL